MHKFPHFPAQRDKDNSKGLWPDEENCPNSPIFPPKKTKTIQMVLRRQFPKAYPTQISPIHHILPNCLN